MNKKWFAPVLLLGCAACGNFSQAIKDSSTVRQQIKEKLGREANVHVNMANGRATMKVAFVNTPYNDSPDEARQRFADSVGIVVAQCQLKTKFESGTAVFSKENKYGALDVTKTTSCNMHLPQK